MFSSRYILHIDGDSFFASCEVAMNPALRGKPVVTGKERGIASSMSYEAKAKGVKRGMMLHEIRKLCPDVVILPSDYETYSLFSDRMYSIVRRYTREVEEYSIDECFADLTGLEHVLGMSYAEIVKKIKYDLDTELGMTFSLGLGPNKVIAKVGSKWKKPSGLTIIQLDKIESFLEKLPAGKIWGIGPRTSAYLESCGVFTALQYAQKNIWWVEEKMSKPFKEIWRELRGEFVYPLHLGQKDNYQSISKTKTFTPPSVDMDFVFAQLSKNVENACIKARRHRLLSRDIYFFLKTQDFSYHGLEFRLPNFVDTPQDIISAIRTNFESVYKPKILYRATGVVLMNLTNYRTKELDLFGFVQSKEAWKSVFEKIDAVEEKFGKHSIFLGSSMRALSPGVDMSKNARSDKPERAKKLLKDETSRQRLNIPFLGEVK